MTASTESAVLPAPKVSAKNRPARELVGRARLRTSGPSPRSRSRTDADTAAGRGARSGRSRCRRGRCPRDGGARYSCRAAPGEDAPRQHGRRPRSADRPRDVARALSRHRVGYRPQRLPVRGARLGDRSALARPGRVLRADDRPQRGLQPHGGLSAGPRRGGPSSAEVGRPQRTGPRARVSRLLRAAGSAHQVVLRQAARARAARRGGDRQNEERRRSRTTTGSPSSCSRTSASRRSSSCSAACLALGVPELYLWLVLAMGALLPLLQLRRELSARAATRRRAA